MAEQDYYQSSDVDRALVPIVEEDESKRTANEKHFRKLDGTYEVAIYENEVHYYDKGTWYDIDNSFVDDGTKLENKQNAFRVNFPKTINEDKSIQVKTKNYSIDWRVIDIDKTIAFKYNDQGIRTQQVQVTSSGTITIDYSLDGDKVLVESRSNGITLSYTYDVDGTLLSMQYNGNEYFYITNMQGDVIELVDINGNKSQPIDTMPGVT